MTEQVLRPCPCCGSESIETNKGSFYYIFCFRCNLKTDKYLTLQAAIKAWNTRAYDAERDELMRVKRAHEDLKDSIAGLVAQSKSLCNKSDNERCLISIKDVIKIFEELLA